MDDTLVSDDGKESTADGRCGNGGEDGKAEEGRRVGVGSFRDLGQTVSSTWALGGSR